MDQATRQPVRKRAGERCEYCQLPQQWSPLARLQVEHIRPKKHGGTDDEGNLALACIHCNCHKGSNLTGIDPGTEEIVELFNPRSQKWDEHFRWVGLEIRGLTPSGRTTVYVMDMNSEEIMHLRIAAADLG